MSLILTVNELFELSFADTEDINFIQFKATTS